MQTMWKFTIGRLTIRARIESCYDLDLSWCETGETAAKLDSGEWEAFDTRVTVELNGRVIGEDSLHGSIYENPADFFSDHRGADPMNRNCTIMRAAWRGEGNPDAKVSICHYFPDMVRQAIAEAREWMRDASLSKAA